MDFLKLIELFFKFIMGQGSLIGERSQEISVVVLNQIRRVLILMVITLGALAMFCMGMSHLIERVLNKLDEGTFTFTPSIILILCFIALCIVVLIYSTNKKIWLDIFKKDFAPPSETSSQVGSAIESAISLLVLDIVKEREFTREKAMKNKSEGSP